MYKTHKFYHYVIKIHEQFIYFSLSNTEILKCMWIY